MEQVGPRLALVLVTDDSDFLPVLREAQARHMVLGGLLTSALFSPLQFLASCTCPRNRGCSGEEGVSTAFA